MADEPAIEPNNIPGPARPEPGWQFVYSVPGHATARSAYVTVSDVTGQLAIDHFEMLICDPGPGPNYICWDNISQNLRVDASFSRDYTRLRINGNSLVLTAKQQL